MDVLDEPGCPICFYLRNAQSDLLQNTSDPGISLCNFHGWGIAAIGERTRAANIFLAALDDLAPSSQFRKEECWVCSRLRPLEDSALSELTSSRHGRLGGWLKAGGAFCASHALKVRKKVPLRIAALIDESDARKKHELRTALVALASQSSRHSAEHCGVLGQAAEYLVSQRGLPV
jgi:hypothetical protein